MHLINPIPLNNSQDSHIIGEKRAKTSKKNMCFELIVQKYHCIISSAAKIMADVIKYLAIFFELHQIKWDNINLHVR